MAEDRAEWEDKVFASEPFSQLPPLATTPCSVEDRGNPTQCRPPSSVLWSQIEASVIPSITLSSDAAEYKMSHLKPACSVSGMWKYVMSNPGLVSPLKPGSATPLAIRSTTYCVPCEGPVALLCRLPLGALVTPLAKQNPKEVRKIDVSKVGMKCRICFEVCVCVILEAPASVHGATVHEGVWVVWSLHVSSHDLAGLWREVPVLLLW